MGKIIQIEVPDWIDESLIEEVSKILLQLELNKGKSLRGLLKNLEKFEPKLSKEDVEKFLAERR